MLARRPAAARRLGRDGAGGALRSSPDDVDDEVVASSDADFGGAVINAVTAVLGVAVADLDGMQPRGLRLHADGRRLYFGTIQQTRMRYQLDHEAGRAR